MSVVVRKAFQSPVKGVCDLKSDEDCFVPELSIPIKQILSQFAFVDNMRLADRARQGYEVATKDENDFDVFDPDQLDPAEKQEIADLANETIDKVRKNSPPRGDTPQVTPQETTQDN